MQLVDHLASAIIAAIAPIRYTRVYSMRYLQTTDDFGD